MAVKETIAFIGGREKTCPVLIKKMAQEDFRLLFVFNDKEQIDALAEELNLQETRAEIEIIKCAKDGCWEADIVAFVNPEDIEANLVDKFKEVATQKVILCISSENTENNFLEVPVHKLQQLLPHSKIVRAKIASEAMEIQIAGEDKEALELISTVFEKPGFKTEIV